VNRHRLASYILVRRRAGLVRLVFFRVAGLDFRFAVEARTFFTRERRGGALRWDRILFSTVWM
jgi:hypothetical protein